jgi:acetyl-CoA carboxylase biotin carboxyl carrier protein
MEFSDEDLATLAEALEKTPFRTLRVEAEGFGLCLKSGPSGWSVEKLFADEHALSGDEKAEFEDDGATIRAPTVGVFYRAPKPGDPPFVEVGAHVSPETVIGIIETMKLMNAVPAGVSGRIAEIVASDAAFIDAGQTLMRIERVEA